MAHWCHLMVHYLRLAQMSVLGFLIRRVVAVAALTHADPAKRCPGASILHHVHLFGRTLVARLPVTLSRHVHLSVHLAAG